MHSLQFDFNRHFRNVCFKLILVSVSFYAQFCENQRFPLCICVVEVCVCGVAL